MKLTFLGAAREVTGPCYLVETGGVRFLVDCGMFQGGRIYTRWAGCPPTPTATRSWAGSAISAANRDRFLWCTGKRPWQQALLRI